MHPDRTPLDLPLEGAGTTFIEASAGTGKTRAITTLVARLVVEQGWRLDRILVVTFTRAATAELRDRIRRTLGGALAAAGSRDSREPERPERAAPSATVIPGHPRESGEQAGIRMQGEREKAEGDSQARELVAAWEQEDRIDLGEAARRLEAALHDIDRAGIRTIHGFCQRALADLAFESGFPFGFEVSGSDAGMVAAAVRDFWRRRLYQASTLLVRHAVESGFLPSGLTEWTSRRRAGGAEVRGGEPLSEPIEALEAVWRREFEAVRSEWTRHRETFRGEILDGDWLNRRSYGRKKVERDLDGLEALFAAAEPRLPPPDLAALYGRERLSRPRSVKKGFAPPEHLHPLFDAFDRLEEASDGLRSACDQWLRWAHRDMLDEVRASVRRRVREDRRLGYDDLLSELGDALAGPQGERLAARIRHEYPCALIDEFQDTDPVQAAIFTRVYGEGRGGAGQDATDPLAVRGERGERYGDDHRGAGQDAADLAVARDERSGDGRRGAEQDTADSSVMRGERSGDDHRGARQDAADLAVARDERSGDGRRGAEQDTADSSVMRGERSGGVHRGAEQDAAGTSRLFVVGDPKQSIYRFRGADVYAYLAARRPARERLALGRNWRSAPALVEAVNAVFSAPDAFVIPGIPYHPVAAARPGGNPLWIAPGKKGGDRAPFEPPPGSAGVPPAGAAVVSTQSHCFDPGTVGVPPATGGGKGGAPSESPSGSVGLPPALGIPAQTTSVPASKRPVRRSRTLAIPAQTTPASEPSFPVIPAKAGIQVFGERRVPVDADASPATGDAGGGAPFEFRLLPDPEEAGKLRTKESASRIAAESAAHEIARLLAQAGRGEAAIGGEPLTGADVAVLVRTRAQGRLIAEALRARGVRSVEIDDRSVFETDEAEQVERLLWALVEPGREARVRGALAGDLFGLDAAALHALDEDEAAWSGWADRIAGWRSGWEARGIGPVLLKLLDGEGGAERLLARPGGVRRLTNFRHLADLLQEAETGGRLAPAELAAWLSRSRSAAAGGRAADESVQLRLESDEMLVRILTVHAAKGLEFPIVFCPFAWDARARARGNEGDVAYHLDAEAGYREVLDLDPDARARSIARVEEFAESVRLLYVALTRAKYRCVVTWGQVGGAENAPLAWLLHRDRPGPAPAGEPGGGSEGRFEAGRASGDPKRGLDAPGASGGLGSVLNASGASDRPEGSPGAEAPDDGSGSSFEAGGPDDGAEGGVDTGGLDTAAALKAAADRFKGLGASDWRGEVEGFAQRFPNAISVTVLDADPPPIRAQAFPEGPPPVLAAREPGRSLRRIRQLTSFTALSAEALAAGSGRPAVERDEAEVDRPDHDQHEAPDDDTGEETDAAGGAGRGRTAFTFPRGPVAGSCLHRIFEKLDEPPGIGPDKPGLDTICRETLEDFGIGEEWGPVARAMVERTRAVRLHERGREGPDGDGGSDERADSTGSADSGQGAGTRKGVGSKWETDSGESVDSSGMDGGGSSGTGGFRLDDPAIRRLVELEFHFPVDGLDRDRLAALLAEHGYPHPFARPARDGAEERLAPIHGFLRGYVDLVVEHAERWYVLDYKSNWLGPAPADYGPEALDATVRTNGYPLQYLIYLVALHRYLATRLPGYDYEHHVGGAFYLFVRGLDPAAGRRRGVYFDRPPAACLHALDECFRGGVI